MSRSGGTYSRTELDLVNARRDGPLVGVDEIARMYSGDLSGVLTWLVTGVRRLWQTQVFATPTGDLKRRIVEESNRIITWLEENCENSSRTQSRELYSNYITWCDATRHRAVSETRFGRDLIGACSELGWEHVDKVRLNQGMVYEGIGLL